MVRNIAEMANTHKMLAAACAEELDYFSLGIGRSKCIDDELMRRVFQQDTELMSFVDKVAGLKHVWQRELCGCIRSFDVGKNDTCQHGCVYCYANNLQEAVENNFNLLSLNGEMLLNPTT